MSYSSLTDKELKELLESSFLEEHEKFEIVQELVDRGSVVLDRIEAIH